MPQIAPRFVSSRLRFAYLIAGGKQVSNADAVFQRLEKARAKYSDMVLVHGGAAGIEKIAASWADRNGVHQIICKPDWDRHGKAAPFRRNGELLNLRAIHRQIKVVLVNAFNVVNQFLNPCRASSRRVCFQT